MQGIDNCSSLLKTHGQKTVFSLSSHLIRKLTVHKSTFGNAQKGTLNTKYTCFFNDRRYRSKSASNLNAEKGDNPAVYKIIISF